jgi:hypothetical protein
MGQFRAGAGTNSGAGMRGDAWASSGFVHGLIQELL